MKGIRTYIASGLGILATLAYGLGRLSTEQYLTIVGVVGFGGMAALRSGVKRDVRKAKIPTPPSPPHFS